MGNHRTWKLSPSQNAHHIKMYLFVCVRGICLQVCLCTMCVLQGGQKRVLDPLEPESLMVVNCHVDSGN